MSTADTCTGPAKCVHLWRNGKPGTGPHQGTGDKSVFYCQWNSNTGNTRHRAKELAPPIVPDLGPWLGPRAQGRHLEGSWALIQSSCCLYWWPGYSPPPTILPQVQETQIYSNCQGQGRPSLQVWAALPEGPTEFLSPQKRRLWLLSFLLS